MQNRHTGEDSSEKSVGDSEENTVSVKGKCQTAKGHQEGEKHYC